MRNTLEILIIICLFTLTSFARNDTLLYSQQKEHFFSSQKQKDAFSLTVIGKNIFDSFVTFHITTAQGKIIYKDKFSMGDLMEFGPPESDKAYRRDANDSLDIIYTLNHFFDEDRFSSPAIKDTIDMDANMEPRKIWWPVYEDKTTIGFHYLLGSEDGRSITYLKKKIIIYFTCC